MDTAGSFAEHPRGRCDRKGFALVAALLALMLIAALIPGVFGPPNHLDASRLVGSSGPGLRDPSRFHSLLDCCRGRRRLVHVGCDEANRRRDQRSKRARRFDNYRSNFRAVVVGAFLRPFVAHRYFPAN